jgi:hypothetical protein
MAPPHHRERGATGDRDRTARPPLLLLGQAVDPVSTRAGTLVLDPAARVTEMYEPDVGTGLRTAPPPRDEDGVDIGALAQVEQDGRDGALLYDDLDPRIIALTSDLDDGLDDVPWRLLAAAADWPDGPEDDDPDPGPVPRHDGPLLLTARVGAPTPAPATGQGTPPTTAQPFRPIVAAALDRVLRDRARPETDGPPRDPAPVAEDQSDARRPLVLRPADRQDISVAENTGGAVGPVLRDDAIRAMVTEIVREELAGELGERITRNVRRLVRREIREALASGDLG